VSLNETYFGVKNFRVIAFHPARARAEEWKAKLKENPALPVSNKVLRTIQSSHCADHTIDAAMSAFTEQRVKDSCSKRQAQVKSKVSGLGRFFQAAQRSLKLSVALRSGKVRELEFRNNGI